MLGFALKPNDWSGLVSAVETASALWGGMFFPMIPIRSRITGLLRREVSRRFSAPDIISGYLDTFDPDVVVKVNDAGVPAAFVGNRKQVSASEIFHDFSDDATPHFGVGITEILSYFANRELTYVRRKPIRIVFPKLAPQYRGFLASIFGSLRSDIEAAAKELLPEGTIETPDCSIENFADFFSPEILFVRRLTNQHLRLRQAESCLYFLNAASAEDIIDYWNLRAAGWSVLPVPQQACETTSIKELATQFVNENYWAHRHNPDFFHNTNVIKARNASTRELVKFINGLSLEPPKANHSPRIVIVPTYPRMWDEWARDKDAVDVQRVYSSKSDIDVADDVARLNFSPVAPRFVNRFGGHGTPRFANDIEIRFYGGSEPYAEVIPAADDRLVRAIGTYGFEEWRFSRRGISYLCRHPEFTVRLEPPRADRVFTEWLRCSGWEVELSDKGYIATQMLKRLGGVWDSTILASRGLVALLRRMTAAAGVVPETKVIGVQPTESTEPAAKILKAKAFIAEISRFCSVEGIREPDQYLRRLLELQIFRLGLEVQCPTCRQRWWQSLKSLDYDLNCPNCFETFSVASWLPKDFEWAFRTAGPFSLPDSAFGVYAVLLTLRFFSRLLHAASTPLLSFKLRKGAGEVEVDLGLLFDLPRHGKDHRDIVFAECKSFNEFSREDVQRLESLGQSFPGAVLVIAVLRDSLSAREQNLLRPFVNRSRKYWKGERPVHPVLILTGNELFAADAPPRAWEKLGTKYGGFKQRYELAYSLADLADATQQIYLDLPPWHQWLRSKRPAPATPPQPAEGERAAEEGFTITTPVSVALRQVEFGDWPYSR